MAERISIRHDKFKKRTDGINTACLDITITTKDVPLNNSCKGIQLREYVKKVQDVANLISRYSILLRVDVNDIIKTAKAIEQADRDADNVWHIIKK